MEDAFQKVEERYRKQGYLWFDTPHSGQITIIFLQMVGKSRAYGINFSLVGIISGLAQRRRTGRICGYFNISWFIECRTIKISTWQTFRRLWPMIAPFKAGLIVAAVALVLNAASDTFMLSLLKPLLDDGFGKTDRSVLLWMPLVVIGLMVLRGITSYISLLHLLGFRQSGDDDASPPVWPYDGYACRLLRQTVHRDIAVAYHL